jgi:PAS domain S-box-containing protein
MHRANANTNNIKLKGKSSDKKIKNLNLRKRFVVFDDFGSISRKRILELDELLSRIIKQSMNDNNVLESVRMLCSFMQMKNIGVYVFDKNQQLIKSNPLEELGLPAKDQLVGIPFHDFCDLLGIETHLVLPNERMQVNFDIEQNNYMLSFIVYNYGYVAIVYNFKELKPELERILGMGKAVQYLWTVLDSFCDGVVVVDNNMQMVYYNRAFALISGLENEPTYGSNTNDMVEDGKFNFSVSKAVMKQKSTVSMVQVYQNGKKCLVTGNPVFDDNGNIKFVVNNVRKFDIMHKFNEKIRAGIKDINSETLEEQETDFIFESQPMQEVYEMAMNVAKVDSPVLLVGESGVGKEIIANIMHEYNEERSKYACIKINCAAIPKDLLESELFGYEEGAFTGALKKGKPGVFELANNGTLFLDEIGDLSMDLQVKLLRVLNDQQITRLGGIKTVRTNARIVTATNKDLVQMVEEGLFRTDLYYRLSVIPIYIPPLREREEDIEPLINHFLKMFNGQHGFDKKLSPELIEALQQYDWPGNVRELSNLIERLVVTVNNDYITKEDLPEEYCKPREDTILLKNQSLNDVVEDFEARYLKEAFDIYGSSYKVAEELNISQTTAFRKAKKYKIL